MRFLHTGDLHIGKTVCDFSLLEDQRHMLQQIHEIAVREKAQALVIAGDVYDRAVPSAEAVVLLDEFLTGMVEDDISVLMISGNHDSPERIGFAGEILKKGGIHVAGVGGESLKQVVFRDSEGEVVFILLPFVKSSVALAKSNGEAVEKLLSGLAMDDNQRYVLITHYFVTDKGREPEFSEAETTIHVGGLDNVEASVFKGFDYVALGHIHKAQQIGDRAVFYAGAPLQYSFSEAGRIKSCNLVEIGKKGELTVTGQPVKPLRQMRKIKGKLKDLVEAGTAEMTECLDYVQATLTDEEELIDPMSILRKVYPNVMQILLSKNELRGKEGYVSKIGEKRKLIPELFTDFYEIVRGEKPDEDRMKVIMEAAREAGEGDA